MDDASKCDDWECRYSFNRIFQRTKRKKIWENMFRISQPMKLLAGRKHFIADAPGKRVSGNYDSRRIH